MRFCARACYDTSANESRYDTGTFKCNDIVMRDKKELRLSTGWTEYFAFVEKS